MYNIITDYKKCKSICKNCAEITWNEFDIVPDSFLTVTNHGYTSLMDVPSFIASCRGSVQEKWWQKRSLQCGRFVGDLWSKANPSTVFLQGGKIVVKEVI